jgi:hypothetical protein
MDSVRKYSVQNSKVLISKVSNPKVNPIRSEWIPSENIRFKIGIFIDWKVAYKPPEGVGRLRRAWVDLGR